MSKEIIEPTEGQFMKFLEEASKSIPKSNRTTIIGRKLWVEIAPHYGVSEEDAETMFDNAASHPDRMIFSFNVMSTTVRFLRP